MSAVIRKIVTVVEEIHLEMGKTIAPPTRRAAAIAVIEASGLAYEVGALGTTVEGSPDELWTLVRAVHEATLHAGAEAAPDLIDLPGRCDRIVFTLNSDGKLGVFFESHGVPFQRRGASFMTSSEARRSTNAGL